jgi:uncharacterized protein DUF3592
VSSFRLVPILIVAAVVVAVGGAVLVWWLRRKTPEQRERERRLRIAERGRITDGTVIDVSELGTSDSGALQLLIYQYDVAGVSYQAAQDVTSLRHYVDLHTCRIGVPASVKYDPQNPGNSIVISESWSGLRG